MKEFRISKYNPIYYTSGKYSLDEWTAYSDIGQIFGKKIFTKEDYIDVENNYILFVKEILKKTQITHMLITKYENYSNLSWKNNQKLSNQLIDLFMRNCLREECWGVLYSKNLIIYVGYDYYLHLVCDLDYSTLNNIATSNSLFCQCLFED